MSGKGSGRRPTNEEQYMSNWDTIFGKKIKDVKQLDLSEEKKEQDELSKQTKDTNQ